MNSPAILVLDCAANSSKQQTSRRQRVAATREPVSSAAVGFSVALGFWPLLSTTRDTTIANQQSLLKRELCLYPETESPPGGSGICRSLEFFGAYLWPARSPRVQSK